MDDSSAWLHDPSRNLVSDPPTADELAEGLKVLKELLAVLKQQAAEAKKPEQSASVGRLERRKADLARPGAVASTGPPIADASKEPRSHPVSLEDELGPLTGSEPTEAVDDRAVAATDHARRVSGAGRPSS